MMVIGHREEKEFDCNQYAPTTNGLLKSHLLLNPDSDIKACRLPSWPSHNQLKYFHGYDHRFDPTPTYETMLPSLDLEKHLQALDQHQEFAKQTIVYLDRHFSGSVLCSAIAQ